MIFDLPKSLEFGGREWAINSDFRDVLTILIAFEDADLTDAEKAYICLNNLYVDYEGMPPEVMQAAFDAAVGFIDHGSKSGKKLHVKTMDWEHDADIIFPAINHVAGFEVRSVEYMHWWTFLGHFMEIKDDTAATVFSLRLKKAQGKKLEKYEREFWQANKALCELKQRDTDEEKAEKERLIAALGG